MILKLYAKKLLTNQIAGILNIYWHGCDYVALNYKEVLFVLLVFLLHEIHEKIDKGKNV